jgi:lysozyme
MNKLIGSIIFVVIATVLSLFYTGRIWFVYPDTATYPVKGIDVSHHQGDIDWNKVAGEGIQFVYIKATEADDFIDKKFKSNWGGAKNEGIKTGSYHFYSLAYPGAVQAKNFISVVPTTTDQLPPAIDLEYVGNSKQRPAKEEFQVELNEFIFQIEKHYGQQPILYTTYDFYDDYLGPEFGQYRIWIRSVYLKPKNDNWYIWQYHPRGRLLGISGPVDLNVLHEKF